VGKAYCTTVTITTFRMLSKLEIENEIIRLLQEGKTYREISKILHVSPTQISAAKKKFEGNNNEPSIQTKAYKMFLKGKRPIDVAITLEIGIEQTTKFWKDYIQLTGHYRLLKIAEELKENLQRFLNIYNGIKKKGLSLEEIEEGIKRDRDIVIIDDELARKQKLSTGLEEQIKEQKDTITNLNIEISTLSIVKMFLRQVVKNLTREKERLQLSITSYGARYNREKYNYFVDVPTNSIQYY
jgi:uncharacterized protein YerC